MHFTIHCNKARGVASAPFTALQSAEVTLWPHMQPDLLPVTFGAQRCLLTAHFTDALCTAQTVTVQAAASHSASELFWQA